MAENEDTALAKLNRLFPTKFGSGDLVGLGQFILNLLLYPGDPEIDAENIASAVLAAIQESQPKAQ